jgi:ankyrin repeat protein
MILLPLPAFLFLEMAKKVDLRGAKDAKGDTVLHFAARKGCLQIYRFLVEESGLDVNTLSRTGAHCALKINILVHP